MQQRTLRWLECGQLPSGISDIVRVPDRSWPHAKLAKLKNMIRSLLRKMRKTKPKLKLMNKTSKHHRSRPLQQPPEIRLQHRQRGGRPVSPGEQQHALGRAEKNKSLRKGTGTCALNHTHLGSSIFSHNIHMMDMECTHRFVETLTGEKSITFRCDFSMTLSTNAAARSPTMGSWAASRRDSPSTAVMWQRRAVTLQHLVPA